MSDIDLVQYMKDQFSAVNKRLDEITAKLEESMKDRVEIRTRINLLETELHTHVNNELTSTKRIWDRIESDAKGSLWSKVPEKILSWVVPLLLAAILWAFMNGGVK